MFLMFQLLLFDLSCFLTELGKLLCDQEAEVFPGFFPTCLDSSSPASLLVHQFPCWFTSFPLGSPVSLLVQIHSPHWDWTELIKASSSRVLLLCFLWSELSGRGLRFGGATWRSEVKLQLNFLLSSCRSVQQQQVFLPVRWYSCLLRLINMRFLFYPPLFSPSFFSSLLPRLQKVDGRLSLPQFLSFSLVLLLNAASHLSYWLQADKQQERELKQLLCVTHTHTLKQFRVPHLQTAPPTGL